ncbi:hypothetical protein [Pararhizobium sp.]|uniref:hypothetical protein n=1 Tax=Pararhizobium sp. TaxID=1977563 RepID=UPI003D0C9388
MWRGRKAVLAIAIRYQPKLTGRANTPSRTSGLFAPAVQSETVSATQRPSGNPERATMTKRHGKIDTSNPFIPSFSPVCQWADTVLIFAVAVAGLVAAAAAIIARFTGVAA